MLCLSWNVTGGYCKKLLYIHWYLVSVPTLCLLDDTLTGNESVKISNTLGSWLNSMEISDIKSAL